MLHGIDEKENVWRVRQASPGNFNRYVTFSIKKGIQAVYGFMSDGKKEIQSLIFAKREYPDKGTVRAWINNHEEFRTLNLSEMHPLTMSACYAECEGADIIELMDESLVALDETNLGNQIENGVPKRLFICREFDIEGRGKVTYKDLLEMKENYENKVRKIDLDIDFDHKVKRDDAAGWYGEMSLEKIRLDDGKECWALFTQPEWTDAGRQAVKSKGYKYFSPEIAFRYYDSEARKWHNNVLLGGGLTNRPQIKSQPAIGEMSEEKKGQKNTFKKEEKMNKLRELLKRLSVSFAEGDDEEVLATKLSEHIDSLEKSNKDLSAKVQTFTDQVKRLEGTVEEKAVAVTKLAETVKTLETEKKESAITSLCEKAIKAEKVAPADADVKEKKGWFYEMFADKPEAGEKYLEKMPKILNGAPAGSGALPADSASGSYEEALDKAVQAKMSEKNVDYEAAYNEVKDTFTPEKYKASKGGK